MGRRVTKAPEEESDEPNGLLDRVMRHEGRGGAVATILVVVGLVGMLIGGGGVASIVRQPWELDARAPVTTSVESECGPFTGAVYTIEVAGSRHACGGGDHKCGEGRVEVAYAADDPSRCRVAANVDRLSRYEALIAGLFCMFALLLIAGAAYRRSESLRIADLADGAAMRQGQRARLRALSAAALLAAIVASNVSVIVTLLGDRP